MLVQGAQMKSPIRHLIPLLAAFISLPAASAVDTDWRVWTLTETKHVLRSDPPGSALAVNLGAARNEWVSFQILLRSMCRSQACAWSLATCGDRAERFCRQQRLGSIASTSFVSEPAPIETTPSNRTGIQTH